MTEITNHTTEFYEHLAYLFYAVAAVDNNIVLKEKQKIKELVDKDWSFGSDDIDSKGIIFSTLKKLIAERYNKEDAFLNYKSFFLQNRNEFTPDIRNKIMDTADRITIAFSGRNKSESVLLSRLYFVLAESLSS